MSDNSKKILSKITLISDIKKLIEQNINTKNTEKSDKLIDEKLKKIIELMNENENKNENDNKNYKS